MINHHNSRKLILVLGVILNIIALLTGGNGVLVAVGCSLIAIGVATSSRCKA